MNTIHVLLSADSKFLLPLKVLVFSLTTTQKVPLVIHFFNNSLSQKEIDDLESFFRKVSVQAVFYKIPDFFKKAVSVQEFTLRKQRLAVETFSRLLAPTLIASTNRILWLDADCLVQQDLQEFYFQDLKGNFIAACDHAAWDIESLSKDLFPRKTLPEYFNAGVILFDLDKCRRIKGLQPSSLEKILTVKYQEFDQSILNYLFAGRTLFCDPLKYNMFLNQEWSHGLKSHPIQYRLYKEAVILHYCSPNKPWDDPCILEYEKAKYWLNVKETLTQKLEG